jgi:hypothetical protein
MTFKSFYDSFDGKNVFFLRLCNGTLFSNQLAGLGDGRERFRDRLNADLIFSTVSLGPYPAAKAVMSTARSQEESSSR